MRVQIPLLILMIAAHSLAQAGGRRRKPMRRTSSTSTIDPQMAEIEIKKNSLTLSVIPDTEYDKYTENFNSDVIHTIAVNPRDQIEYNFSVDPEKGKFIWISYIVKDEAQYDFQIMDNETHSVLHTISDKTELMAQLYYIKRENIRLVFRNRAYNTFIRILVSLECHDCNSNKQLAEKENVQQTVQTLKSIDYRRSRMFFLSELYKEKQSTLLKKLKLNHQRVYLFTVAEIAAIAFINFYQICAIRNLLNKKSVL